MTAVYSIEHPGEVPLIPIPNKPEVLTKGHGWVKMKIKGEVLLERKELKDNKGSLE